MLERIFHKSGPNSQKLERNDIIEFFQCEGQIRYDSIIQDTLFLDENFNEKAYKDFLKKAGISEVLSRDSILKNLGCIEFLDGRAIYTNTGALFFRNNSEDVVYQHATVVCALYKGLDKVYILDAKEFSGGIIENIDEAVLFLKRNLKLSYEIKTVQRKNILEIPEDALREAVINAVCHRNYFEKGAMVMVEIFDDRVEITNPGGLPKGLTAENFGTMSVTRNPVIASLLHRIHYIERMGTGIERIRNAMKEAGLAEPFFDLEGFFKVVFKRKNFYAKKEVKEKAEVHENFLENFLKNFLEKRYSKTQKIIVEEIIKNNKVTQKQLSIIAGVSERTIRSNIEVLKEKGIITRIVLAPV